MIDSGKGLEESKGDHGRSEEQLVMHADSGTVSMRSAPGKKQRYICLFPHFPRRLNDDLLRKDLIRNHVGPAPEFLARSEAELAALLEQ